MKFETKDSEMIHIKGFLRDSGMSTSHNVWQRCMGLVHCDCMFVINGILCVFHFQVTISIQLTDSVTYLVSNASWHQIRVQGGLIYGLRVSPESEGMKFSIIIQNTLRSLQGNHY